MLMNDMNSPSVMIVVGEASGDLHGANLILELKKLFPKLTAYGLGGVQMRKAGVEIIADVSELSVIGLTEIIKHYPRLRGIQKQMINTLKSRRPSLLILIDSPDFNLALAKNAKQSAIKVLYYISPQIWAWRTSRIKIIKKCVNMMAVVFPFEVKFYENAGIPVEYVGHPLINDACVTISKDTLCKNENLDPSKFIIGLFPGSRKSEIERNYPILIAAAEILSKNRDDIQYITPIATTLPEDLITKYVDNSSLDIKATTENIYNVINACDAIGAASGTVTLQITLMQTPYLILYKISPITFQILKCIVNFKFAGIANIIANKMIAKEFIQQDAQPKAVANELEKLISDDAYIDCMKMEMAKIKKQFGEKNGSEIVAKLSADLINTA